MQFELELLPSVPECLVATYPGWSGRYDAKAKRLTPAPWIVRPGVSQSRPRYLPPTWAAYVQPEGQLYFASDAFPRTVTDGDFYDPAKQLKIMRFAELACKVAEARNIVLPETAELYLEPHASADSCYYYFVDHATQSIFWLDECSSEYFGFYDAVSDSHSGYMLEQQYWGHVEQFPSHRAHQLSLRLYELIPAFQHGECDQRTSSSSTFIYSAKECKHFLRLLHYAREDPCSPFNVCLVARLWGQLSCHRHRAYYGQQLARLDRTTSVVEHPEKKRGLAFAAASHLLLGLPGQYAGEMDGNLTDGVATTPVWRDFFTKTHDEWRQSLIFAFPLSILNAILLLVPGTSKPLAFASLLCCAVVALSTPLLQARPISQPNTHAAGNAMKLADGSDFHCRSAPAVAFALPRAFYLWATVLTVAQAVVWLERTISECVPLQREVSACIFAALTLSVVLAACVPWRCCGAAVARAIRLPWWRRQRSEAESAPELCEKV